MESACDEQQTGIAIIPLGREYGSADLQTLAELEGHLLEAIDRSPAGLLIDLGETIHIGCEFLSILLRCYVRVRKSNGCFALCALNSLPESVFAITRLDSLWKVFRTRREAIEAMQPPLENEYSNDGFGSTAKRASSATCRPRRCTQRPRTVEANDSGIADQSYLEQRK